MKFKDTYSLPKMDEYTGKIDEAQYVKNFGAYQGHR